MTLDDLEGECTVFLWDGGPFYTLCRPDDRVEDQMFRPRTLGGTCPDDALREAYRLLAGSRKMHRLMVILTDGDWYEPWSPNTARKTPGVSQAEHIVEAMRDDGVTTVLAFLPTGKETLDGHHCEFAESVDDPHGLARLFRRVAAQKMLELR